MGCSINHERAPRRLAVLYLTGGGERLARVIAGQMADAEMVACDRGIKQTMAEQWGKTDGFVCIMAAGIVVRALAPLVGDKKSDPAVVVCDEAGRFAVSLLSGHLGGANELAHAVAAVTGGQAVITTASDVLGHTPLDLWCRDLQLTVTSRQHLTRAMGKLISQGRLKVYTEIPLPPLPPDLVAVNNAAEADIIISCRAQVPGSKTPADGLLLHPRVLVVGIGCNRGTSEASIAAAVGKVFLGHGLSPSSIRTLASIDLKADEAGLLAYAKQRNLPVVFFDKDQLNTVEHVQISEAALKATGARGVAEPAAILASGGALLINKTVFPDVTVAVGMDRQLVRQVNSAVDV